MLRGSDVTPLGAQCAMCTQNQRGSLRILHWYAAELKWQLEATGPRLALLVVAAIMPVMTVAQRQVVSTLVLAVMMNVMLLLDAKYLQIVKR